ncbi:hypothetical protein Scep_007223 [Stephania cephalantha]|uniref:Uncharacterized protein n=1 Tax=Stephania cephalantha TaxID=152367 RepID=A0AAP0PPT5_9MAGN
MLGGPSQAVQRTLITGTIKVVRSVRYMGRPSSGSGCVVRWQQGRGPGGQEAVGTTRIVETTTVSVVTVGVGTERSVAAWTTRVVGLDADQSFVNTCPSCRGRTGVIVGYVTTYWLFYKARGSRLGDA